jgi:hypothetical protein
MIFKVFLERMENSLRMEIEKFNGHNFELQKLKIKYVLIDREKWEIISTGTISMGKLREEWEKIKRRARSMI